MIIGGTFGDTTQMWRNVRMEVMRLTSSFGSHILSQKGTRLLALSGTKISKITLGNLG